MDHPIDTYLIDVLIEKMSLLGPDIILCDVDGVLFDNTHRLHHIVELVDGKEQYLADPDWASFNSEVGGDEPMGMCHIIGRMSRLWPVVFLTARESNAFQITSFIQAITPYMPDWTNTRRWFVQFRDVSKFPPEVPSHVYKRAAVDRMRAAGLNPVMAIDDSLDQVNMYRDAGIVALRCHDLITEKNLLY